MKINPENIHFILVEPKTPGNIGAAARAIKTMGFGNLTLINPGDPSAPEARWMAHAAEDVLENAGVFAALPEALKNTHFVVATTQRVRGYHFPYYTPAELGEKLIPLSQAHRVAIVFGREVSGLTNEELRCCHAISTIPAAVNHPSLNLAQAVMVYAYELFKASFEEEKRFQWRLANYQQMEGVYEHLRSSLERVNFVPMDSWENFMMRFRRMFARANPEVRDVKVMHKILQAFDEYIRRM
ncbi:MAG: RNA methyltransferase [Calditrichaceae bacterium]|nr:RNA methyltransferase [Calditrichia bacterium]NUQ43294.1 RNA methyltransferase [Calditrichaceae bacterium]